jgi:hypothetical protein
MSKIEQLRAALGTFCMYHPDSALVTIHDHSADGAITHRITPRDLSALLDIAGAAQGFADAVNGIPLRSKVRTDARAKLDVALAALEASDAS